MKRKHRDTQYILSPSNSSYGRMICEKCGLGIRIQKDDFRVSKKNTSDGDWGYCTIHRKCLPEEEQKWVAIENRLAEDKFKLDAMLEVFEKLRESDRKTFLICLEIYGENTQ